MLYSFNKYILQFTVGDKSMSHIQYYCNSVYTAGNHFCTLGDTLHGAEEESLHWKQHSCANNEIKST